MNSLPAEMWFGNIAGQWPIYCWESDAHAMAWLRDRKADERRVLWKAKVVAPVEYEAVIPKPYLEQKVAES